MMVSAGYVNPPIGDQTMKAGTGLAILAFVLVAVAHLLRFALGVHMTIGTAEIPMWVSGLGVVVPLALAWLLMREWRMVCKPEGAECAKTRPAPQ